MTEKKDATKKSAGPKTTGRRVELDLPCRLNQTEILSKGDEVAKLHGKLGELRIKKKLANDEMTGEIKATEAALSTLVGQIATRSEKRSVPCVEEIVERDGIVQTRRLDTKQIVLTRTMTGADRQPGLFEAIPGGKADEGKADSKGKDAKKKPALPAKKAEGASATA